MSGADNSTFRLISMPKVNPQLVRLDLLDERRRVHGGFIESTKKAISRMTSDPVDWGDPIRRYRHLDLIMYRGTTELLLAYYAVDETNRLVYVRGIEINPMGPLADPG